MITKIIQLTAGPINILKAIPEDLIALIARLAIASVFWRSAQTKINGWEFFDQSWQFYNLNNTTLFLFEHEYDVPLLNFEVAAYLATFAEFFLSLAIVAGLATRLSAFGLLAMTMVIQTFVYPESWSTHILWAALLLYLIKHGSGKLSVDYFFSKS